MCSTSVPSTFVLIDLVSLKCVAEIERFKVFCGTLSYGERRYMTW